MAGADYMRCSKCGCKTFYDADVQYSYDVGEGPVYSVGQVGALCVDCSAQSELVIVARDKPQPMYGNELDFCAVRDMSVTEKESEL